MGALNVGLSCGFVIWFNPAFLCLHLQFSLPHALNFKFPPSCYLYHTFTPSLPQTLVLSTSNSHPFNLKLSPSPLSLPSSSAISISNTCGNICVLIDEICGHLDGRRKLHSFPSRGLVMLPLLVSPSGKFHLHDKLCRYYPHFSY